jgi:hypothetical protein
MDVATLLLFSGMALTLFLVWLCVWARGANLGDFIELAVCRSRFSACALPSNTAHLSRSYPSAREFYVLHND